MVKFCSNCGGKLKENADICLNCGVVINNNGAKTTIVDNRKKKMPGWGIALIIAECLIPIIVFCMLMFLSFFAINDSIDKAKEKQYEYGERHIKRYENEYNIVEEGSIGDSLDYNGLRFTLNKVNCYDSIGTNYIDDEDEEYVVFFFDIENTSDKLKSVSLMNFHIIGEYEDSTPEMFISDIIDDISRINIWQNIDEHGKITGYVTFRIDRDIENFNLIYSDIFDDSAILFNITNGIVRKA